MILRYTNFYYVPGRVYQYSSDAVTKMLAKIAVCSTSTKDQLKLHIDGHKSNPTISILAIVQESRKTSAFRYFSTYSFHFIT